MGTEANKKNIKNLIIDLVTSVDRELDPTKMKRIKSVCKKNVIIETVKNILFEQLKKNNSDIRLLCLKVLDELFVRSHTMRTLVIESFTELTVQCTGVDGLHPLPPPTPAAKRLQGTAIATLKRWIGAYSGGYSKLRVCHEALKLRVNFDTCSLLLDLEEQNRQRDRDRRDNIWRGRIIQVEREVGEGEEGIRTSILETRNSVELWQETRNPATEDPLTAAVCDQYNLLNKRLIPLCKKWTINLTKAGSLTNQQLLRRCVDLQKSLEDVFAEVINLGIDFNKYKSQRHGDSLDNRRKKKEEVLFEDPTTWAASLAKLKDKQALPAAITSKPLNPDFLSEKLEPTDTQLSYSKESDTLYLGDVQATDMQTLETITPSCSEVPVTTDRSSRLKSIFALSSGDESEEEEDDEPLLKTSSTGSTPSNIPTIQLSEILTPQRIDCEGDKQSVWLNGEREGESFIVNPGVRRVVDFSGTFVPVTRSCGARLESGGLCPRQDRVKCPFHGLIVERDAEGSPVETQDPLPARTQSAQAQPGPLKRKKNQTARLCSDASIRETARARLEKKVFNKAAVKRVSRQLDGIHAKRNKSLFSEQFNYSM